MKKATTFVCVILVVAGFTTLATAASQAGGLPALELRVQKLEGEVAALISQVGSIQLDVGALKSVSNTLQNQVNALQNAVASLQNTVANLGTTVADLQGQNNWAAVTGNGVIARASNRAVSATQLGTGTYSVQFPGTDVTKCAYAATIRGATPGFITVTAGIFTGGTLNDVQVQTFDKTGAPADFSFHLYVSCP
ncbi:MAG: hypothetical protein WAK48_07395 [Candidatus Acidiferrum sp.]|jgi:hypothetical protein